MRHTGAQVHALYAHTEKIISYRPRACVCVRACACKQTFMSTDPTFQCTFISLPVISPCGIWTTERKCKRWSQLNSHQLYSLLRVSAFVKKYLSLYRVVFKLPFCIYIYIFSCLIMLFHKNRNIYQVIKHNI